MKRLALIVATLVVTTLSCGSGTTYSYSDCQGLFNPGYEEKAKGFCDSLFGLIDANGDREISGPECSDERLAPVKEEIRNNNLPEPLQGDELNGTALIRLIDEHVCAD